MFISLYQILQINLEMNFFYIWIKMQIIVFKTLKSGKNLYLYLYRPSPTGGVGGGPHDVVMLAPVWQ